MLLLLFQEALPAQGRTFAWYLLSLSLLLPRVPARGTCGQRHMLLPGKNGPICLCVSALRTDAGCVLGVSGPHPRRAVHLSVSLSLGLSSCVWGAVRLYLFSCKCQYYGSSVGFREKSGFTDELQVWCEVCLMMCDQIWDSCCENRNRERKRVMGMARRDRSAGAKPRNTRGRTRCRCGARLEPSLAVSAGVGVAPAPQGPPSLPELPRSDHSLGGWLGWLLFCFGVVQ